MNLTERKKLFEKACKELSKEDLELYLFGLIEMVDKLAESLPLSVVSLLVYTQKVLTELDPKDAEATRTISNHFKAHYQEAANAELERN